jgi:LysM repeat protein
MSSYGVFFRDEAAKLTVRLPTNPEEIERSTESENEEYEVLKLGKISVPGVRGLMKISFEAQLPSRVSALVETSKDFKKPDYYIDLFNKWMKDEKPVRFVCTNGVNRDLSLLVTITEFSIIEKAGEEGDYYVKYTLVEYVPYSVTELKINPSSVYKPPSPPRPANPPQPPYQLYTIVSGDCLWNIAKRYLGNGTRWTEIYAINRPPLGGNPNLIYPGQRIKIPGR